MPKGAITGYIDVAQLALYAFFLFFGWLVFYLRREDKREVIRLNPSARVTSLSRAFPRCRRRSVS